MQGSEGSPHASVVEAAAGLGRWASLAADVGSSLRLAATAGGGLASLPISLGPDSTRATSAEWHKLVGPGPLAAQAPIRGRSNTVESSFMRVPQPRGAMSGIPDVGIGPSAQLRQLLNAPLGTSLLGAARQESASLAQGSSGLGGAHLMRPPDSSALQAWASLCLKVESLVGPFVAMVHGLSAQSTNNAGGGEHLHFECYPLGFSLVKRGKLG